MQTKPPRGQGAAQAAVIDRFTPHRALPNLSDRVRWSVIAWVKEVKEVKGVKA